MKKKLIQLFDNLFYPIHIKHHGYWKPPLKDAEELINYATNHTKDNKNWIEKYTSIDDKEKGTIRTLFLDFDLTTKSYLKETLTSDIANDIKDKISDKIEIPIDSETIASFIDKLSDTDIKKIAKYVEEAENEKLSNMNEPKTQEYFFNKINHGYLKEPFADAIRVYNYFKKHGVETVINWSGSKGIHLRIPLNELHFEQEAINKDPKLFILSLVASIETAILDKPIKGSTLDYNVFNKNRGLERLPCSKHETSHLYSNFFDPELQYEDAVKHIVLENPSYIPDIVNKDENTKSFLNLSIVKEAIQTATTNNKLYNHENDNPFYNPQTDKTTLAKMIKNIYVPGSRNEIGYRVVHVLRRAGYSQEEVEEIFLDIHDGNRKEFNETIGGSIKVAYTKDIGQLCGLKHLINGIETLIKSKNKSKYINFFKSNFDYYEKPTETLATPFTFEGKEITVKIMETSQDKWIVFESIFEGVDLNINFNNWTGSFIESNDNIEIISFEFKFNKRMFKVTKEEKRTVRSFLANYEIKISELFFDYLKQYFRNEGTNVTEKKQLDPSRKIYVLFTMPNVNLRNARRHLGHFLKEKGMILRQGINTPYFLDKKSNGFNSVTTDDIVMALDEKVFNHEDVIHTADVEEALGFIADRRRPVYNIVKFPNCLYDIENFKIIKKTEKPIFTLTEVKYNYNPKAKGDKIINFLKTSLKQKEDDKNKIKERVIGFLEMIGYLLTSGNKLTAFFIIAGIGGAGKGVATNLIVSIFGTDKVGGLQLQELTPDNKFATSHLESKQVNIVRDSPKKPIKETGMLKSITGYDDVPAEPKGRDKYMIAKEEVPDMILVCNNMPKFEDGIEGEVVQRIVMFEFLNRFRGTDNDNKNLLKDILENDEEMEWLLYNGIKAYENMVESGKDFKARIDEDKTRKLLGKHTDPITFVLPELVNSEVDEDTDDRSSIIAKELNELIIYLCNKKGVSVTDLDDHGHIKPRVLAEKIRAYFEFDFDWTTESKYISDLKKSVTVYPNIYKTADYDDLLEQMKKDKNKNEETE